MLLPPALPVLLVLLRRELILASALRSITRTVNNFFMYLALRLITRTVSYSFMYQALSLITRFTLYLPSRYFSHSLLLPCIITSFYVLLCQRTHCFTYLLYLVLIISK